MAKWTKQRRLLLRELGQYQDLLKELERICLISPAERLPATYLGKRITKAEIEKVRQKKDELYIQFFKEQPNS